MNQILVAPCPNCSTDASKHNKVLYDGIFLICHSCGYGWYYNIQILNTNLTNEYNSKSTPLSTLPLKEPKPHLRKTTNIPVSKRNIKNKTNREPSVHALKNHTYTKKKYTPSNTTNFSNSYNKQSSYSNAEINNTQPNYNKTKSHKYSNTPYDNNIYYNQTNKTPNIEEKINFPLQINKVPLNNIPTNIPTDKKENVPFHFEKPQQSPNKHLSTEKNNDSKNNVPITPKENNNLKEVLTNKQSLEQKIIIKANNTPSNTTNELIINLSKLPTNNKKSINKENIKTPNSNKTSTENRSIAKEENINTEPTKKQPYSTTSNTKSVSPSEENKTASHQSIILTNKANKQKEDNTANTPAKLQNHTDITITKPTGPNTQHPISEINIPLNIPQKEDPPKEEFNFNNTSDFSTTKENFNTHSETNYLNEPHIKKLDAHNLKLALDNFNMSLSAKESLGLKPSSLLKVEEQAQYNINKYTQFTINNKRKSPVDIKEYKHKLKNSFSAIFKSALTIFTRPDLLLKTCAYIFILGGAISFLWYSNSLKHKKVKETSIHNPSFNNNLNNSQSKSVKFDDNVDITGMNTNSKNKNEDSFNNENFTITKEDNKNKINAFQKNNNNQNSNNTSSKSNNVVSNSKASSPTFFEDLKYKIKDSWLSIKQHQQNTFSDIKVYQKNFKLNGEYNEQLISNTTLYNNDSKNSYLIKSIEIVFLENTGKIIGKRTILANQIINRNSGIDLNLQINNPPVGAKNMYVFIKDKKKI